MIYNEKNLTKDTLQIMKQVIWFLSNIAGGDSNDTNYLISLGVFKEHMNFLKNHKNMPETILEEVNNPFSHFSYLIYLR